MRALPSVIVALWMLLVNPAWSLRSQMVFVTNGWMEGTIKPTHIEYLGVPYATVTKRFQAPGPEPTWTDVKYFNDKSIRCTQRGAFSVSGTEDCLILNIYTPTKESADLRSVMVFMHGGGFRDGSSSPYIYGPEHLIKHDVILITINYRVEVLGFLCTGTEDAPGNAGLKDQVAALKWIKRNVRQFGGDPDNITIFGESAGASSVMYHMISPMSKGLFHRAIMQSGTPISCWSIQFEPLKIASLLAKSMGYDTEDPTEIVDIFLNKTDVELLTARVPRKEGDMVQSENIFVPCIEKELPGVEAFLLDTPYNIISNGLYTNVPLIIGHNSEEGYFFTGKENDTTISKMNFYDALPRDLEFPTDDEKRMTAQKMNALYMGDEEIEENIVRFSRFEGEAGITYPVAATIDLLTKTSTEPVFAYNFSHSGSLNFIKLLSGFGFEAGATHADELLYLFKLDLPTFLFDALERNIIRSITTMWTNFAKYGEPVPQATESLPEWPPVDKADPQHLVIDEEFTMAPVWNERLRFWNDTYTTYRKKV